MTKLPESAPAGRLLRILVAEDDDAMRALLAQALSRAGHHVVALEDGFELGDYLELTRARGGPLPPPDVIVSDVRMPGRDGLEVLRRVSAAGLMCPVVLLSAFADEDTHAQARALGARALLDKPVDLDVVRAVVEEAVAAG
ncbi:response regulator [Myxococcaceae bacterium GXIMD 01537]